jgi:hypothetical protein
MIWWTGLAPWLFEFPFPGSFTSSFSSILFFIHNLLQIFGGGGTKPAQRIPKTGYELRSGFELADVERMWHM